MFDFVRFRYMKITATNGIIVNGSHAKLHFRVVPLECVTVMYVDGSDVLQYQTSLWLFV